MFDKINRREYVINTMLESITNQRKGENVYREHQVFHEEMITSMLGNFSEEEYILAIALEKLNSFFEEKYEGLK